MGEEEMELYFRDPEQLMSNFTELEEKNLLLIQSSQQTEQLLDELQHQYRSVKQDMGGKVSQLKDHMKHLNDNIAGEKKKCEQFKRSYEEKAGTASQDKKLAELN